MRPLATLAVAACLAAGAAESPKPTHADVPYGPHARNVLDFWKADTKDPAPVLVFIHGGGFTAGDKTQASPQMLKGCLEAGISFAAINYRYTTTAPFPAPMLDGARAVQFLRSRAKDWNLDPSRIAAYGGSAGAGMSMWLGFHEDLADPGSEDPVARESTRLACVGSMGGQCTYDPRVMQKLIGGRVNEHRAFPFLYGVKSHADLEDPKLQAAFDEASPITHLTKDDPPVFMVYSEPDEDLPADAKPGQGVHHPRFGHLLKAEMDKLGIASVYRHASDGKGNPQQAMLGFFVERLRPEKPSATTPGGTSGSPKPPSP